MSIKVGIISIGEMGLGTAKLLMARQYAVTTCLANRSEATRSRAKSAGVEICEDYESFVNISDVILSIVPPKDALATAKNVANALGAGKRLFYFDLNAVSPASAVKIGRVFPEESASKDKVVTYYDGGIIGGPPKLSDSQSDSWDRPSMVISGPHAPTSSSAPSWLSKLAEVLNMTYLSDEIGKASGLKMCFASLTKGYTSLAIQSYTTAHRLGVLPELQKHLGQFSPLSLKMAERGLCSMPPKAYRWVNEMEEISKTYYETGFHANMFDAVADVFRIVSEETVLGEETTDKRKRGLDPEDVADCINQGLLTKRQKK